MLQDDILKQIDNLSVWQRGDQRAPHKPLLLLLALGKLIQGEKSLQYIECENKLVELLREFGPSRSSYHPEYPFWRLQRDGLWRIEATIPLRRRKSQTDIPKSQLRLGHAVGSFPDSIQRKLLDDRLFFSEVVNRLLCANFPESIHRDILDSVGISLNTSDNSSQRDPQFRKRILAAYEYRCALCGLDLRINNITIALEAAHIKWVQAGGPNTEENGVALCCLHHKLFDLGAFTIQNDYRVLLSEQVHGRDQFNEVLMRHHGQRINMPLRPDYVPLPKYLEWHRHEVFKGEPRHLSD